MDGKAKETAPFFLFTRECEVRKANGKGPARDSAGVWQLFSLHRLRCGRLPLSHSCLQVFL